MEFGFLELLTIKNPCEEVILGLDDMLLFKWVELWWFLLQSCPVRIIRGLLLAPMDRVDLLPNSKCCLRIDATATMAMAMSCHSHHGHGDAKKNKYREIKR